MADKGPVLNIPFASGMDARIGDVGKRAKESALEVKRLSQEMERATRSGKTLSGVQVDNFNKARRYADGLKKEWDGIKARQRNDRAGMQDFRTGQFWDRARGRIFGSLASGDIAGLTQSLLSSGFGAKLLRKAGFPNAGASLARLMPKAFAIGEVIQGGVNAYQAAKGSERSDFAALQAWKKGEISNQTLLKVLDIDDGLRWRVAAQALPLGLNNIFDSPEEAKEAIIAKAKTSTDKELFPWMKKAMDAKETEILNERKKVVSTDSFLTRDMSVKRVDDKLKKLDSAKKYQEEVEKALKKIEEEYKGESAKVMTTERVGRLKEKYKEQSKTLEEDLLELETEAKKLFILDDVSKGRARAKKETKNNSKAFWEEEERRVIEETFREYRRGYVPFNRNE